MSSYHVLALCPVIMYWHYVQLSYTGIMSSYHVLALCPVIMYWHYVQLSCTGILSVIYAEGM